MGIVTPGDERRGSTQNRNHGWEEPSWGDVKVSDLVITRHWPGPRVCVWAWSVITLRNICTGDGTAAKWEHAIKPAVQNMSVRDFFFNLQVRSCWFFG